MRAASEPMAAPPSEECRFGPKRRIRRTYPGSRGSVEPFATAFLRHSLTLAADRPSRVGCEEW